MAYAKSLTNRIKAQRTPLIIERDYAQSKLDSSNPSFCPIHCAFCGGLFVDENPNLMRNWEHLDNNPENEELWNLAWVHAVCNQKKKNDFDLQIFAQELIKKNQAWENSHDFGLSSACAKKTEIENATEIELSAKFSQIVTEYLAESIHSENPRLEFTDALYCIVRRCRKATGHGSSDAIRKHLNENICSEALYEKVRVDGEKFIQRRSGR